MLLSPPVGRHPSTSLLASSVVGLLHAARSLCRLLLASVPSSLLLLHALAVMTVPTVLASVHALLLVMVRLRS